MNDGAARTLGPPYEVYERRLPHPVDMAHPGTHLAGGDAQAGAEVAREVARRVERQRYLVAGGFAARLAGSLAVYVVADLPGRIEVSLPLRDGLLSITKRRTAHERMMGGGGGCIRPVPRRPRVDGARDSA